LPINLVYHKLSVACFPLLGVLQGAPTSLNVFNVAFNLVYVLILACKPGCTQLEGADPWGSNGFADDTALHTDSSDAVPAMQVIVQAVALFLTWLGLLSNMCKSIITATDHAKNGNIETDSITFNGMLFTVLPPDTEHKVLGVLMTLTGNYKEHKEYGIARLE
jgi:hypothetical protein